MNQIDFDSFVAFSKTLVGRELDTIGGKSKFVLENITEHAYYYRVPANKVLKQNLRYVKRVLEQYANLQSLNPGHYANITPHGLYILALIQLYENSASRKPQQ
jgi:hypothetical protein